MKKVYVLILCVLVGLFTVSGILAFGDWYREDRTTNVITVSNLSAELIDEYEQDTVVMPGDRVSKVICVRNTGDSDGLVRVKLEGCWNDTGESPDPERLIYDINTDDWIRDDATGYWYYKEVLPPGALTRELMRAFELSGPLVNNAYSYRPGSIYVTMEMVQAAAGGASVWGKSNEELGIEYNEDKSGADGTSDVQFDGAEQGFSFGEDGDLFSSFKNLLPGQVLIQEIGVGSTQDELTEIFLKALPTEPEELRLAGEPEAGAAITAADIDRRNALLDRLFTEYIDVTVKVGGKQVYHGPVWNFDEAELYGDGISLGRFEAGAGVPITVELAFNKDAGNEFQDLVGRVDWLFYARGTDKEPVPQTGDSNANVYVAAMLISGLGLVILIVIGNVSRRKRRRNVRPRSAAVLPVLVPVILCVLVTVPGTMAFMTDREQAENDISAAELSIELSEPGFEPDKVLRPGEIVSKNPVARNCGTVDMLAYIAAEVPVRRVRTVDPDTKMIVPASEIELFSFEPGADWILMEPPELNAGENGAPGTVRYVYGYAAGPLHPGETTTPLFETVTFANILEGELGAEEELDINVYAMGLQYEHVVPDLAMEARLAYGYSNFIKEK